MLTLSKVKGTKLNLVLTEIPGQPVWINRRSCYHSFTWRHLYPEMWRSPVQPVCTKHRCLKSYWTKKKSLSLDKVIIRFNNPSKSKSSLDNLLKPEASCHPPTVYELKTNNKFVKEQPDGMLYLSPTKVKKNHYSHLNSCLLNQNQNYLPWLIRVLLS